MSEISSTIARKSNRYRWLDISRGAALLAMASYHLLWDFQAFGYLEPGTASTGLPKLYARAIATTFLFLVGVSLVIAQTPTIRWRHYLNRWGRIALAAAAVTIATYFTSPGSFIYFGILHSIAVASLIGLLFIRAPPALTLLVAIAAIIAPFGLRHVIFNQPWLWWTGLATGNRPSDDFVPILPWIAPVLLGIAITRLARQQGWLERRTADERPPRRWSTIIEFLGKHSLIFYLVHQPVLIAAVYGLATIVPPAPRDLAIEYQTNCVRSCTAGNLENFCIRFCSCTLARLLEEKLFTDQQSGKLSVIDDSRVERIGAECTRAGYQEGPQ